MLTIPKPRAGFSFRLEGEADTYTVPHMKDLPVHYSKRLRDLHKARLDTEELGMAFVDLFTEVLDEYAPGVTRKLSMEALGILVRSWTGEDLGESAPRPR